MTLFAPMICGVRLALARCIVGLMVYGIRTALFSLILLALPLSGFAGGAMLHCVGMPMPASQSSDKAVADIGIDRDAGAVLIASARPPTPDCGTMPASAH